MAMKKKTPIVRCKACGANPSDYADKTIDVNGTEREFEYDVENRRWEYCDGAFTYALKRADSGRWVFTYFDGLLFEEDAAMESSEYPTINEAVEEVVDVLTDYFQLYGEALGYAIIEC